MGHSGSFKKGDERINRKGRPEGSVSFNTKWKAFLEKVGKQNSINPEEVEEQLLAVGYKFAKEGNFSFWSNLYDRNYGKPSQPIDVTGSVQLEQVRQNNEFLKNLINKYRHGDKGDKSEEPSN